MVREFSPDSKERRDKKTHVGTWLLGEGAPAQVFLCLSEAAELE